jgi:hypothetical protein
VVWWVCQRRPFGIPRRRLAPQPKSVTTTWWWVSATPVSRRNVKSSGLRSALDAVAAAVVAGVVDSVPYSKYRATQRWNQPRSEAVAASHDKTDANTGQLSSQLRVSRQNVGTQIVLDLRW